MTDHILTTPWTLELLDGPVPADVPRIVPATVPGTVHTDLLAVGAIPDPYLDRNEELVQWIGETDVAFSTRLDIEDEGHERIDLAFDGLDTVATVSLGEAIIGRTRNQHRRYRFDVTDLVRNGARDLRVYFGGALREAREAEARMGERPHVGNANPYNALRKMACNFGWDWGPVLVTAGIDAPVHVHQWSTARLAEVVPLVTVDGDSGLVTTRVRLERTRPVTIEITVRLTAPDGTVVEDVLTTMEERAEIAMDVAHVERWWPRGHGDQPLYRLQVELRDADGTDLDAWERRVGFREVEVRVAPDEYGTGFTLLVNGRPILVKGANWIPDDCFLPRVTTADYERGLRDAIEANMNLVRVWGGGIYERDAFYDVCDREGLLVWQDFAFACAAYAEDAELWDEVEAEARENVARLAPHPSLVFWNGGNENIEGYWHWGWKDQMPEGHTWGLGYYEDLLPRVLAEVDPIKAYRPSSPFNPDDWSDVRNPDHGTVHSWVAWNQRDWTAYGESVPRFVAEFGFQGPPNWSTFARAIHDDPLTPTSPGVLAHQKADDGQGKLARGYAAHLPEPVDIDGWHVTTQFNQARALQYGIEHFRSWWPRTTGTIVWQLNDCWPVSSWAAVDGDGHRKPLWHALRAVYADRLVTVQPRGNELAVVALNDDGADWAGDATVRRLDLDGTVLDVATIALQVPSRGAATLLLDASLVRPADPAREVLMVDVPGAARAWYWFAADKDLHLDPADVEVVASRADGGVFIEVAARNLVKDLTLAPDRLDPAAIVDSVMVTLLPG